MTGKMMFIAALMSGCAGYDIEWQRGETYDPVVLAACKADTDDTDWPCMEENGCA